MVNSKIPQKTNGRKASANASPIAARKNISANRYAFIIYNAHPIIPAALFFQIDLNEKYEQTPVIKLIAKTRIL